MACQSLSVPTSLKAPWDTTESGDSCQKTKLHTSEPWEILNRALGQGEGCLSKEQRNKASPTPTCLISRTCTYFYVCTALYIFYMYACFLSVCCICALHICLVPTEPEKNVSGSPGTYFKDVCEPMWVLRNKPQSSLRAPSTLDHGAIFPVIHVSY